MSHRLCSYSYRQGSSLPAPRLSCDAVLGIEPCHRAKCFSEGLSIWVLYERPVFRSSIQAWNMRTSQSINCQFLRPARCSFHFLRIGTRSRLPSPLSRDSSSRASAQSRNGPRSQASSGTANPVLGRSKRGCGTYLYSTWRRIHLPCLSRILRCRGRVQANSSSV